MCSPAHISDIIVALDANEDNRIDLEELRSLPQRRRGDRGRGSMSFRVCIACYGIRVYPYMGFMVGQQFGVPRLSERMVIPLEFDNEADYRAFRDEMLADDASEE